MRDLLLPLTESVKPRILFSTKAQEILQRLSINITIGEKLTILDKSNVSVDCSAEGVPPPSLSWSKDGVKLTSLQSNLLHLRNIAREDTGRYTCTAENFLGFVSQSTLLSVRGRYMFWRHVENVVLEQCEYSFILVNLRKWQLNCLGSDIFQRQSVKDLLGKSFGMSSLYKILEQNVCKKGSIHS